MTLQKKWRNIRDCFVKAHKAKDTKSGSAAKKKIPYVFYNNLLFLKDTISVNTTISNVTVDNETNSDPNEVAQNDASAATNFPWTPARKKQKKNDDHIGQELIQALNRNFENKKCEDDEDRLFFLSLVKEFKKIPDDLRMQTKLDLLKVIRDAQFSHYPTASWASPYRGYQTAHHPSNIPSTLPKQSYEVRKQPLQETVVQIQSPLSMDSTGSQDSVGTQESQDSQMSFVELFNSIAPPNMLTPLS